MAWTQTILDFVADIIWPLFALCFVLVFRAPIVRLIDRVKHGKGWGFEFEAEDIAKDMREVADSLDHKEPMTAGGTSLAAPDHPSSSAASRVLAAWTDAEELAAEIAEDQGIPLGGTSNALSLITAFYSDKRVSEDAVEVVMRLRNVRNSIAHGLDVTDEAASSILLAIQDLDRTLRRATKVPGLARVSEVVDNTAEALRQAGAKPGPSIRNAYGASLSVRGAVDPALLDDLVKQAKGQGVRLQLTKRDAVSLETSPATPGASP